MNALELLRNDHVAARGLLADLEEMNGKASRKKRMQMVNLIEREVKIHSELEEKIFYPAFRKAGRAEKDSEIFYDAVEAHHLVDKVLPDLKLRAGNADAFAAKLRVVRHLVVDHAEMEEREMFGRARELLGDEQIDRLGDRMTREKQKLLQSWQGTVTGPARRVKSLVDKATPLRMKKKAIERRAAKRR